MYIAFISCGKPLKEKQKDCLMFFFYFPHCSFSALPQ